MVCHLETEQPFLARSLGHLAAEVMGPMATASLSSENRGNVIRKWIWTEECVLGQEDEQHSCAGCLCTLESLESRTNAPFWKCYTDTSSSMHISIVKVLRSPAVKTALC